jgi:hypothetical protein
MTTLADCREAATRVLAAGAAVMDDAFRTGGPMAVAALAYTGVSGGPSREEIAAMYVQITAEAAQRQGEPAA